MGKQKMGLLEHFDAVMGAMTSRGLLLGSYDASGKANIMTLGWGTIGNMWSIPMWNVLVRPSRYTYECIEHSGCFTVNVPPKAIAPACATCGTKSGRDIDKFAECNLTAKRGQAVSAPMVAECPIVYECEVVHSNDVQPDRFAKEIISKWYPEGDFHRVFFGKILAVHAEPNAAKLL